MLAICDRDNDLLAITWSPPTEVVGMDDAGSLTSQSDAAVSDPACCSSEESPKEMPLEQHQESFSAGDSAESVEREIFLSPSTMSEG